MAHVDDPTRAGGADDRSHNRRSRNPATGLILATVLLVLLVTSALIYAVVQVARTIERRTPLYTAGASSYELSVDGKFLSVEQEVCVDSSTPQSTAILYGLSGNAGEKYPGSVAVATVPSGCSTIGLTAIPVPSAFLPTTDPCAPLIMEGVFQAIVADRPAELFTVVVDQCDPKA